MSGYIGNIPVPQATQTRDVFTATAGQTSFSTSGYTPTFLDVYLNGVHLVNGTDYTATNGSDVVLAVGATLNDVLEVVAFSAFQTGDFVPVTGGTFSGNVTANSLTSTTLSDGTNSVPVTTVIRGSAKAWVNFNGEGTIAARDSENVSSLTDNGVGQYTVNLSNNFDAADYASTVGSVRSTSFAAARAASGQHAVGSFFVHCRNLANNTDADQDELSGVAHGDLA